jgi:hypothetical protein
LKLSAIPVSTFEVLYALGKLSEIANRNEVSSIILEAKDIAALLEEKKLIDKKDDFFISTHSNLSMTIAEALSDRSLTSLPLYILQRLVLDSISLDHQYRFATAIGSESMLAQFRLLHGREKGIFLKVSVQSNIFTFTVISSGIESVFEERIQNIERLLQHLGLRIMALEFIPVKRIDFFPFFFVGSELIKSVKSELKEKYNSENMSDNRQQFLKKWYLDYLSSFRELGDNVPRVQLADSAFTTPIRIVIITNMNNEYLIVREYFSSEDSVDVRIEENMPNDNDIDRIAAVSSSDKLYSTRHIWSSKLPIALEHPYVEAFRRVTTIIHEFNKYAQEEISDISKATEEQICKWTGEEISSRRKIVKRLEVKDEDWTRWLSPISVKVAFTIAEQPSFGERSGDIITIYSKATENEITVKRVKNVELREISSSATSELHQRRGIFLISHLDLLRYIMERTSKTKRLR